MLSVLNSSNLVLPFDFRDTQCYSSSIKRRDNKKDLWTTWPVL